MAEQENDDIIRAKQAISPAGLADQSAEGNSGPGAEPEDPELPENEGEDTTGNKPANGSPMTHPNRNIHKSGGDNPGYGGGH